MHVVRISIPIYLPNRLYHLLRRWARHRFHRNLWGDRDIEYSFIAAHMPTGPGEALDFGSGASYMSLLAARRGFRVIALDLEQQTLAWLHPAVQFVQGDLLKREWLPNQFDLVINCSTVEHIGLVGRYSVTEAHPMGDLEAMAKLRALMKPNSVMMLTIPIGQDAVFAPLCRVYGEQRLPLLLDGYDVVHEEFWVKNNENRWVLCDKATALRFQSDCRSWDPLRNVYALGCFALRPQKAI